MTDAATTAPASASPARSLPGLPTLVGIGVALGGVVIFAGNYNVAKGENGGLQPALVTAAIVVALAAVLTFVVVPRVRNVNRTVVILSVAAIVTIVAFWAGVTPLLAAVAVGVGAGAPALSKSARILQRVAVVAGVATVVFTLAQSHLF